MARKFDINYAGAISEFEQAIKKFQIKRVIYKTIFRGKGLEFDAYRNFEQDDDATMIDWKASLRANRLLAKQYVEERDLNVYFAVNVSSSMLFGSGKRIKAEYTAELVAALAKLILDSGDNVGLILFSDKEVKLLSPGKGKNQLYIITKLLADPSLYGGNIDFDKMLDRLLKIIKSQFSVVILISDFLKVKKDSLRNKKILGSRFETFSVMIRDLFDDTLPKSGYQMVVEDPYSGRQMVIDTSIAAKKYQINALKQKNYIKKMFKQSNIDCLDIHTDKSFTIPLISFLKQRARGGSE